MMNNVRAVALFAFILFFSNASLARENKPETHEAKTMRVYNYAYLDAHNYKLFITIEAPNGLSFDSKIEEADLPRLNECIQKDLDSEQDRVVVALEHARTRRVAQDLINKNLGQPDREKLFEIFGDGNERRVRRRVELPLN